MIEKSCQDRKYSLYLCTRKVVFNFTEHQAELFVYVIKWRGENSMDIQVGNVVTLKKQHPCGSHDWEVLRVGIDFRLKCQGCGHQIMLPRKQVERSVKQIKE